MAAADTTNFSEKSLPLDIDASVQRISMNSALSEETLIDADRTASEFRNSIPGAAFSMPDLSTVASASKASTARPRTLSPGRTFSLKEYEQQLSDLKKENFNLKLRIHFLEEQLRSQADLDGEEEIYKLNLELQIRLQTSEEDSKKKDRLLTQFQESIEALTRNRQTDIDDALEEEVEKRRVLEHDLHESRLALEGVEKALKEARDALARKEAAEAVARTSDKERVVAAVEELERQLASVETERERLCGERDVARREVEECRRVAGEQVNELQHELDHERERADLLQEQLLRMSNELAAVDKKQLADGGLLHRLLAEAPFDASPVTSASSFFANGASGDGRLSASGGWQALSTTRFLLDGTLPLPEGASSLPNRDVTCGGAERETSPASSPPECPTQEETADAAAGGRRAGYYGEHERSGARQGEETISAKLDQLLELVGSMSLKGVTSLSLPPMAQATATENGGDEDDEEGGDQNASGSSRRFAQTNEQSAMLFSMLNATMQLTDLDELRRRYAEVRAVCDALKAALRDAVNFLQALFALLGGNPDAVQVEFEFANFQRALVASLEQSEMLMSMHDGFDLVGAARRSSVYLGAGTSRFLLDVEESRAIAAATPPATPPPATSVSPGGDRLQTSLLPPPPSPIVSVVEAAVQTDEDERVRRLVDAIDDVNGKLEAANHQLDVVSSELEGERTSGDELRGMLAEKDDELRRGRDELAMQLERLVQARRQIDALTGRLEVKRAALIDADARGAELRAELAEAEHRVETIVGDVTAKEAAMKAECVELRRALDATRADAAKCERELNGELERVRREAGTVTEVEHARTKYRRAKADAVALRDELGRVRTEVDGELERLRKENAELLARLGAARTQVGDYLATMAKGDGVGDVARMKAKLAKAKEREKAMTEQLARNNVEFARKLAAFEKVKAAGMQLCKVCGAGPAKV